jgi:hypothetical protein
MVALAAPAAAPRPAVREEGAGPRNGQADASRRVRISTRDVSVRGVDQLDEHGKALADAFAAGLLVADETRLRLTERGVLLSNEVFQALV